MLPNNGSPRVLTACEHCLRTKRSITGRQEKPRRCWPATDTVKYTALSCDTFCPRPPDIYPLPLVARHLPLWAVLLVPFLEDQEGTLHHAYEDHGDHKDLGSKREKLT